MCGCRITPSVWAIVVHRHRVPPNCRIRPLPSRFRRTTASSIPAYISELVIPSLVLFALTIHIGPLLVDVVSTIPCTGPSRPFKNVVRPFGLSLSLVTLPSIAEFGRSRCCPHWSCRSTWLASFRTTWPSSFGNLHCHPRPVWSLSSPLWPISAIAYDQCVRRFASP